MAVKNPELFNPVLVCCPTKILKGLTVLVWLGGSLVGISFLALSLLTKLDTGGINKIKNKKNVDRNSRV